MSFTTPLFLLFLPAVVLTSRHWPARTRWIPLLAASYFFYAYHNPWLLLLVLLTTLSSYLCGLRAARAETTRAKKRAVGLNALVCLSILFVFKYLDFATAGVLSLGRLFGVESRFDGFGLLLPMGISFYVFQTMSYTIDVARGRFPAERHLGYYALFVVFFPQLVAGPIERPGDLLPQLRSPCLPDRAGKLAALRSLLRGYAKKVLIADFLAPFVNAAYGAPDTAGGAALAAATVLFAVQIYCDFSGYSDIAVGCAQLLGVRLTENFRRPYRAVTLRDFWRRWHISLTRWFTDYVFIPLGGSRRGTARTCRNILVVFLLSGLWHGADATYLVWGGLHGLFLVGERLLHADRVPATRAGRGVRRTVTLLLVCLSWVFFRAASLPEALVVLRAIFSPWTGAGLLAGLAITPVELLVVIALLALLPLVERLPVLDAPVCGSRDKRLGVALGYFLLLAAVVLCRCIVLSAGGASAFLYFQF